MRPIFPASWQNTVSQIIRHLQKETGFYLRNWHVDDFLKFCLYTVKIMLIGACPHTMNYPWLLILPSVCMDVQNFSEGYCLYSWNSKLRKFRSIASWSSTVVLSSALVLSLDYNFTYPWFGLTWPYLEMPGLALSDPVWPDLDWSGLV